MNLELQINTLKKQNVSSIRNIIGEKLYECMQKKGYTQETFGEQIGKSSSYINQLIKGKTGTSKVYINLFQILGIPNQEIIKIYQKAFEKEKNIIFGDLGIKTLTLEDNGQEPITTKEEAEKVLFKINGIRPTEEALRSIRLAIDMVKFEQNKK